MKSLWERLQGLDHHSDEYDTLRGYRKQELYGLLPVPYCCPEVAGMTVPYASYGGGVIDFERVPKWMASYDTFTGMGGYCPINCCPFCGRDLPLLRHKDPMPDNMSGHGRDGCCDACGERNILCQCTWPTCVWEAVNAPKVTAVLALIWGDKETVLSVSRKTDHLDKGLPGGKVEPGETFGLALTREVWEETGLVIQDAHLIFDAIDDAGSRCLTYRVTQHSGSIATSEKGLVEWCAPKQLIQSSFGRYNNALFKKMDFYLL